MPPAQAGANLPRVGIEAPQEVRAVVFARRIDPRLRLFSVRVGVAPLPGVGQLALAVARYLVVFLKRPGGQAQFSTALSLQTVEDRFGPLHDWIGTHLAADLSLPVLASRAGMSERSFSRRYLEATGRTPVRAVEAMRVEAARRLLSETRQPVKRIAVRCGFGTEETMRRSFQRLLSVPPQDYRHRFSG